MKEKGRPLPGESRYVEKNLKRFEGMIGRETLKNTYRDFYAATQRVRRDHILALWVIYNPIVESYVGNIRRAIDSNQISSCEAAPIISPNPDVIVDNKAEDRILESHDDASFIEEAANNGYDMSGISDVGSFGVMLKHTSTNAAQFTEENITEGGESRNMRGLRELMRKRLGKSEIDDEEEGLPVVLNRIGLKRHSELVWARFAPQLRDRELVHIETPSIPVGEYGRDHALRIFKTENIMLQEALKLGAEARQISMDNGDVLLQTARGSEGIEHSVINGLQEGIMSLAQAVYLLTAEKIPGYEDPKALTMEVINVKLPNELARTAPAGIIGPLSFIGKSIRGLVVPRADGLELNPEIIKIFRSIQGKNREKAVVLRDIGNDLLPSRGSGCPFALTNERLKPTGVELITNVFGEIYSRLR